MSRSRESVAGDMEPATEIDLRALGAALKRRRRSYLLPTLLAFVGIGILVNVVPPRYTGESQVLLENQETFFTRPDHVNLPADPSREIDQEGVASQVQLVGSPDIARKAIQDLGLRGNPEFDPSASMNPLMDVLVLLGIVRDPAKDTLEARMTKTFLDRLTTFSPPKTRVITIQFTSKDPHLAARAANTVAELYIQERSAAKRAMAKETADALAAQIADLRTRLASADAERERYRLQTGLLAGSNNMTITGQQLADINSDLSKARTTQADAQAKASMIRDLLRAGQSAAVPDVINNDIVRRIWDQRSVAQAQLALESRTLLPGHPRVKALQAQVDEYDTALKSAARQAAVSLENEAKIAGARVANLEAVLGQQKKAAGVANGDEVHLRALERTSQSLKDQLESSMTKYEEAQSREASEATPADARIITRASEPDEPSFPKKWPFTIFATVATLFFSVGFVVASELLSGRASVAVPVEEPRPVEHPRTVPAAATLDPKRASSRKQKLADEPHEHPDLAFGPAEPTSASPLETRVMRVRGIAASAIAYLRGFGKSADATRASSEEPSATTAQPASVGWDPASDTSRPDVETVASGRDDVRGLIEPIVAAHVPGRGLHVVGASLGTDAGAAASLIDLGRSLAVKGRTILVDLNRSPTKLAPLCEGEMDGRTKVLAMNGLAELLAGDCSFAEVIHRDTASRLHFIPAGRQEADFRDFDLILDALSETYDFIVLMTPPVSQSEIAKVMAPYADFVVLAAVADADRSKLTSVETELLQAGARRVLAAGAKGAGSAQNVA